MRSGPTRTNADRSANVADPERLRLSACPAGCVKVGVALSREIGCRLTDGLPLGLLDQRFIDRKDFHEPSAERTRARRAHLSRAIEDKESRRWTDVVEH